MSSSGNLIRIEKTKDSYRKEKLSHKYIVSFEGLKRMHIIYYLSESLNIFHETLPLLHWSVTMTLLSLSSAIPDVDQVC